MPRSLTFKYALLTQKHSFPEKQAKQYLKEVIEYAQKFSDAGLVVKDVRDAIEIIKEKEVKISEMDRELIELENEMNLELTKSSVRQDLRAANQEIEAFNYIIAGKKLLEARNKLKTIEDAELKSDLDQQIFDLSELLKTKIQEDFSIIMSVRDDGLEISTDIFKYHELEALSPLYTIPLIDSVYQIITRDIVKFCLKFLTETGFQLKATSETTLLCDQNSSAQPSQDSVIEAVKFVSDRMLSAGGQSVWFEYLALNFKLQILPVLLDNLKTELKELNVTEKAKFLVAKVEESIKFDAGLNDFGLIVTPSYNDHVLALFNEFGQEIISSIVDDARRLLNQPLGSTATVSVNDYPGYIFHSSIVECMNQITSQSVSNLPNIE